MIKPTNIYPRTLALMIMIMSGVGVWGATLDVTAEANVTHHSILKFTTTSPYYSCVDESNTPITMCFSVKGSTDTNGYLKLESYDGTITFTITTNATVKIETKSTSASTLYINETSYTTSSSAMTEAELTPGTYKIKKKGTNPQISQVEVIPSATEPEFPATTTGEISNIVTIPSPAGYTLISDLYTHKGTQGITANTLFGDSHFLAGTDCAKESNKGETNAIDGQSHKYSLRVKQFGENYGYLVFKVNAGARITVYYNSDSNDRRVVIASSPTADDALAYSGDVKGKQEFVYYSPTAQTLYLSSGLYSNGSITDADSQLYIAGIKVDYPTVTTTISPTSKDITVNSSQINGVSLTQYLDQFTGAVYVNDELYNSTFLLSMVNDQNPERITYTVHEDYTSKISVASTNNKTTNGVVTILDSSVEFTAPITVTLVGATWEGVTYPSATATINLTVKPTVACTALTYEPSQNLWIYPGQQVELSVKASYNDGTAKTVDVPATFSLDTASNENTASIYLNKTLFGLHLTGSTPAVLTVTIPETFTKDGVTYDISGIDDGFNTTKTFNINVTEDNRSLATVTTHKKWWFGSQYTGTDDEVNYYIKDALTGGITKYKGNTIEIDAMNSESSANDGETDRLYNRGGYYKIRTSGPGRLVVKMGMVDWNDGKHFDVGDYSRVFNIAPATQFGATTKTISGTAEEHVFSYYTNDEDRVITLINQGYDHHNIYYIEWIPLEVERIDWHSPGNKTMAVGEEYTQAIPTVYFSDGTHADVVLPTDRYDNGAGRLQKPLLKLESQRLEGDVEGTVASIDEMETGRTLTAVAAGTATVTLQLKGVNGIHSSGKEISLGNPTVSFSLTVVEPTIAETEHKYWQFSTTTPAKAIDVDENGKTIYTIPFSALTRANNTLTDYGDLILNLNTRTTPDFDVVDFNGGVGLRNRSQVANEENIKYTVHSSGTFRMELCGVTWNNSTNSFNVGRRSASTYSPAADGEDTPVDKQFYEKEIWAKHYTLTDDQKTAGVPIVFTQQKSGANTYHQFYFIEWIPDYTGTVTTSLSPISTYPLHTVTLPTEVMVTIDGQTGTINNPLYMTGNALVATVVNNSDGTATLNAIAAGTTTIYMIGTAVDINGKTYSIPNQPIALTVAEPETQKKWQFDNSKTSTTASKEEHDNKEVNTIYPKTRESDGTGKFSGNDVTFNGLRLRINGSAKTHVVTTEDKSVGDYAIYNRSNNSDADGHYFRVNGSGTLRLTVAGTNDPAKDENKPWYRPGKHSERVFTYSVKPTGGSYSTRGNLITVGPKSVATQHIEISGESDIYIYQEKDHSLTYSIEWIPDETYFMSSSSVTPETKTVKITMDTDGNITEVDGVAASSFPTIESLGITGLASLKGYENGTLTPYKADQTIAASDLRYRTVDSHLSINPSGAVTISSTESFEANLYVCLKDFVTIDGHQYISDPQLVANMCKITLKVTYPAKVEFSDAEAYTMAVGDQLALKNPKVKLPDGSTQTITLTESHLTLGTGSYISLDGTKINASAVGGPQNVTITIPEGSVYDANNNEFHYAQSTHTIAVTVVAKTYVGALQAITQDCQMRGQVTPLSVGLVEEGYVYNQGVGSPDQNRGATINSLPNPVAGYQVNSTYGLGFKIGELNGRKAFIRVYAVADKDGVIQLLRGGSFENAVKVASAKSDGSNRMISFDYAINEETTFWINSPTTAELSSSNVYFVGFDIGFYFDTNFQHTTNYKGANAPIVLDPSDGATAAKVLEQLNFGSSTNYAPGKYTKQVKKTSKASFLNIPDGSSNITYSADNECFTVSSAGKISLVKPFYDNMAIVANLEGGAFTNTTTKKQTFFPDMTTDIYVKMKAGSKVCEINPIADRTMYSGDARVATRPDSIQVGSSWYYTLDVSDLVTVMDKGTSNDEITDYDLSVEFSVASYNCTSTQLAPYLPTSTSGDVYIGTNSAGKKLLYIKNTVFAELTLNIDVTVWPTETTGSGSDSKRVYFPDKTSFKLKCMPYFKFDQKNVRFNVTSFAKEIVRAGDTTVDFNGTEHGSDEGHKNDYPCSDTSLYKRCTSASTGGQASDPFTHYYYIPTGYKAKTSVYVPYYNENSYVIIYSDDGNANSASDKTWKLYYVGSGIEPSAVNTANSDKTVFEKVIDIAVSKKDGTATHTVTAKNDKNKNETVTMCETTYYRLKFKYLAAPTIAIEHYDENNAAIAEKDGTINDYVYNTAKSAKVTFTKSTNYNSGDNDLQLYFTKDTSVPAWDYSGITLDKTNGTLSGTGAPVASTLELTTAIMNDAKGKNKNLSVADGGETFDSNGSWHFTTQRSNKYYIAQFPKVDNFYTGDWSTEGTLNKKTAREVSNVFPLVSQGKMVSLPENNMAYVTNGDKLTVGMVRELYEGSKIVASTADINSTPTEYYKVNVMHATYGKSGVWYKNSDLTDFEQGIFKWDDGNRTALADFLDAYQFSTTVSGKYGNPVMEVASNIGDDKTEAGGRFRAPVSGAFLRFEPEYDGVVTAWMRTNGAAENNMVESGTSAGLLARRPVYVMDENGIIMLRTTIRPTPDNYFCINGTFCRVPGAAEFTSNFERAWQYGTEHSLEIRQKPYGINGNYIALYYLYAYNYDWLNLNFDSEDLAADPVNRYRIFNQPIYGSDKLALTKINWLETKGGNVVKPEPGDGNDYSTRYYLDGFARYGYEIPSFYYVKYQFPVKAGKTYFLGGRFTKNGINAVKFEPLRANYQTWIFRDKDDNPTLKDDGTIVPYNSSTNAFQFNGGMSTSGLTASDGGRNASKVYWSYGEIEAKNTVPDEGNEGQTKLVEFTGDDNTYLIKTYVLDEKSANGLVDATVMDNSDDSDNLTKAYTSSTDNSRAFAQRGLTCNVKLKRKFTAGMWHPIVLPFSVSETRMKQIFGDDVMVLYLDPDQSDVKNTHHQTVEKAAVEKIGTENKLQLTFTCHYYQMLYANMPAFICPTFKWKDSGANTDKGHTVNDTGDNANDGKRQGEGTTASPYFKENITFERVTYVGNRETRCFLPTAYAYTGSDKEVDKAEEKSVYVDLDKTYKSEINTYGYYVESGKTEDSYIGYPIGGGYKVVGSYKKNDSPSGEMYYLDNIDKGGGEFEARIKRAPNGVKMKGTRVWIEPIATSGGSAPAMPLAMVGVRSFSDKADSRAGEIQLSKDMLLADEVYDDPVPEELQRIAAYDPHVYNTAGIMVGMVDEATTFESIRRRLPAGVYIFQGKKIVKQ